LQYVADLRKQRMEQRSMSFEEFGEDLGRGSRTNPLQVEHDVGAELLLEEVKIGALWPCFCAWIATIA